MFEIKILQKIANLDRRYVFLFVAVAVIVPLLIPLNLPVQVTEPVRKTYEFVDSLPAGSVIWVGFDYYNTTRTECDPMVMCLVREAFSKNLKVFVTSTIPDGNAISQEIMGKLAQEYGKKYGVDYCILGYKPGSAIVIRQVCANIRGLFPADIYSTPLDEIPMMKKVNSAKDISMAFTSADNASFDEYAKVANTQFHLPVAGGSTAVSVPALYVFYNSGQILGLIGGLKGAAEYEALIRHPDIATASMDAQSIVHLLIVLMILFSNVVFFLSRNYEEPVTG